HFDKLFATASELIDLVELLPRYIPLGGPTRGWFESMPNDCAREILEGEWRGVAEHLAILIGTTSNRIRPQPTGTGLGESWKDNTGRLGLRAKTEGTPSNQLGEACCRLMTDLEAGEPSQSATGKLAKLMRAIDALAVGPDKPTEGIDSSARMAAAA